MLKPDQLLCSSPLTKHFLYLSLQTAPIQGPYRSLGCRTEPSLCPSPWLVPCCSPPLPLSFCLHALSLQGPFIPHLVTVLLAPSCGDSELAPPSFPSWPSLFSFPVSVSTQSAPSCAPVGADVLSVWEASIILVLWM